MDSAKPENSRGCNDEVTSGPVDVNKTGYDEEPARYMAAPEKGFWRSVHEAIKQWWNK